MTLSTLKITDQISLPLSEITFTSIRAQGAGGQHVNKVSSAIHLRFQIKPSSLPESCKKRLLATPDHRITENGVVIIKSQQFRSLEKNKAEALHRLAQLIERAAKKPKRRRPTKPSRSSVEKRLHKKTARSKTKKLREKVNE